jgi:nucleoside-diphosphate-sugar epimerase
MNIKILILGSNGFLGKNLKNLFKNLSNNIELLYLNKQELDISNKLKLGSFFEENKPDIVINCCGVVGSSEINKNNDQLYIFNENTILNINILDCCKLYNVKKIILFSTYRLLNNDFNIDSYDESNFQNYFHFNEKYNNIGYLLSKHVMDMQIKILQKNSNIIITCLILPNIFGLNDTYCNNGKIIPSLLFKFKHAILNNTNIYINCNENNKVNLIYINDLVNIIKECCIEKDINGNMIIFNPNGTVDLKKLTELIKSITNFKNKIIFENPHDNKNSKMAIPNTFKFNSFFPKFEFTDISYSLCQTIDYYFSL